MKFENIEINSERWFDLTPLLNEEFKDIEDFEELYEISNYGRIKSNERYVMLGNNKIKTKTKILKLHPNIYGYYSATINNKKKRKQTYSHIEVAKTFIPNSENKKTVNHTNGNKMDNRVCNLQWATHSEQLLHAYNLGLREKPYGSKNTMYGKKGIDNHLSRTVYQCNLDGKVIKTWGNAYEASKELKIWQTGINRCCLGKTKQYKGFVWKY